MQISAECRWFTLSNATGELLRNWFFDPAIHGHSPGGGAHRKDCYLYDPAQMELGIKRRGSQRGIEIKGLICIDRTPLYCGTLTASVEIWAKWTSAAMDLSAFETIAIEKTRWLRKFDTSNPEPVEIQLGEDEQPLRQKSLPAEGCNVEVTEIEARGCRWFSLGLEAFGQFENVDASIRRTAKVLASRNPPEMPGLFAASYPQWISDHGKPQVDRSIER
jgi:hypothetical protein